MEIYVMNADGSKPKNLTNNATSDQIRHGLQTVSILRLTLGGLGIWTFT